MTAQDFVVFLIVLAAAAYLVRMLTQSLSGRKSCGGCGASKACGSAPSHNAMKPAGEQLIQIGLNGSFTAGRNGGVVTEEKRSPENSSSDK